MNFDSSSLTQLCNCMFTNITQKISSFDKSEMKTSCIACSESSTGMISIYQHPKELDKMFEYLTSIEVLSGDFLCVSCYDDLKSAVAFKKKCIESIALLRKSTTLVERKEIPKASISDNIVVEIFDHEFSMPLVNDEGETIENEPIQEEQEMKEEVIETSVIDDKPKIKVEKETKSKERRFKCTQCEKAFVESGNLKVHIRSVHENIYPYECPNPKCKRKLKTHYSYQLHLRSCVTKERPFVCEVCEKSFYSSGKLAIHRRIHTGIRPYTCEKCDASFTESSSLKRHSKVHNKA